MNSTGTAKAAKKHIAVRPEAWQEYKELARRQRLRDCDLLLVLLVAWKQCSVEQQNAALRPRK
jgi:hypothetical protein